MNSDINTFIEAIFQIQQKEKKVQQMYESMRIFDTNIDESIIPQEGMCWFKISQE